MSRYDLTDVEWRVIGPLLPNKPRGVRHVDDRRVPNGIFWMLRSGSAWRNLPKRYGPKATCYNRFVRWRKAGVWDRLMDAITAAYDGDIQMIDSTSIRAHQQAPTPKRGNGIIVAVVDRQGLPLRLGLTHLLRRRCSISSHRAPSCSMTKLRRQCNPRPGRVSWRSAQHPGQVQPEVATLLLEDALSRTQSSRALLQQAQALPQHRNPL